MKPTPGLDLLEQAFGLLRRAPSGAWLVYFLGTGLFWMGFLFFWEEMTHNALAVERAAVEALLLSGLLLGMFIAQSIFSIRLRQLLEPGEPIDYGRLLLLQCLIQPTKLIVLPAAAAAMLPFAPTAAFYQHFAALRAADVINLRTAMVQSCGLTQRGTGQTWTALSLFAVFGLLVWGNLFIFMAFLPELSRMLLGIESEFNRAGVNLVFTSTFFRLSIAVTYCVLEPLWRAAQVLRSFEGESITTGADLRRAFRRATMTAVLLLVAGGGLRAGQPIPPPQLEESIEQTLQNPEFAWHGPRVIQKPRLPGWLEALQNGTRAIFRSINNGLRTFFDWLESTVDRRVIPTGGTAPARGLRTSSYLVIALCVALILGLAIRQWRTKPAQVVQAEAVTPAMIELADETLLPTDRPEDEWTILGRDLVARGENRLALRAYYLGSLAYIAQQQWIQVHRGKSNLDYLRELGRRAKGLAGVESSFAENLQVYERSWYGEHLASAETVAAFVTNLERIKSHA
jgi:hypothetical protein